MGNVTRPSRPPRKPASPPPAEGAPAPARGGLWAAAGVLLLAGLAAYANSFGGPFIFDDLDAIPDNPAIRSLWDLRGVLSPPAGTTVEHRPILNLTFAANYASGGTDVTGYHVTNLAVHLLAALTLFGLVRRTLLLPVWAGRFARSATGLAFAVALLWTLHPLQTESVTYVVQRAEALMGLFYLLTLYGALRAATAPRPLPWQAAAVAACLLGMGSKEVMVSAPLAVVLYDRVFVYGSFREVFRRRVGLYAALAATWVLLVVLLLSTGGRTRSAGFGQGLTVWEYARTQPAYIVHYLRLCFWPHPLVLDYGTAVVPGGTQLVFPALGLTALLAGSLYSFRWQPWLGYLGVAFFALLAPSSSVVPVVTQTGAEHRMYLPLAAVVILVVLAAHLALEKLRPRLASSPAGRALGRFGAPAALVLAATAFGVRTFLRNADYRTAVSIWQSAVDHYPQNPRAHGALGLQLLNAGEPRRAIAELDEALAAEPEDAQHYNNRGSAYEQLHDYEPARRDADRAIALKPDWAEPYNNRGNVYAGLGRYDEALRDYTQAVELRPDYAAAYSNRGNVYLRLGKLDLALLDYTRALELRPDYASAYNNRGSLFGRTQDYARALADFDAAIRLKPGYAEAYANRAVTYYRMRQYDRARADAERCRQLGGKVPEELFRPPPPSPPRAE